jgi:hypothetical protein
MLAENIFCGIFYSKADFSQYSNLAIAHASDLAIVRCESNGTCEPTSVTNYPIETHGSWTLGNIDPPSEMDSSVADAHLRSKCRQTGGEG